MKIIYKMVIISILTALTLNPVIGKEPTIEIKDSFGEKSGEIILDYVGWNKYDVYVEGFGIYEGSEINFTGLDSKGLKDFTLDLGEYYEEIIIPNICDEEDYECMRQPDEYEKVVLSGTVMFGSEDELSFKEASLKLKRNDCQTYEYVEDIGWGQTYIYNKTVCPDIELIHCDKVKDFTCYSGWETYDSKEIEITNEYILLNINELSGWIGTSYFYTDFEGNDSNLCNGGLGYTNGKCDGSNTFTGNAVPRFFNKQSGLSRDESGSGNKRAYAWKALGTIPQRSHYSRVYIYLNESDYNLTGAVSLFGAIPQSGKTTTCGFRFTDDKQLRCIYDESTASPSGTKSTGIIDMSRDNLFDRWFELEYYVNASPSGDNDICECYINGELWQSVTDLNYDNINASRFTYVGQATNAERGQIYSYYDEHRAAPILIGTYPRITDATGSDPHENVDFDLQGLIKDFNLNLDINTSILGYWDSNVVPPIRTYETAVCANMTPAAMRGNRNSSFNLSNSIAEYWFDNDATYGESDSYVYDHTGLGNNLTCDSGECPDFSSGAVLFDGDDDYLYNATPPNNSILENEMTLLVWLHPLAWANDYHGIAQRGTDYRSCARGTNNPWVLSHHSGSDRILFTACDASGAINVYNDRPAVDEWTFVSFRIYVADSDGKQYGEGFLNGNLTHQTSVATPKNILEDDSVLWVGKSSIGTFNGSLENLRIFNYSLTRTEIRDIYVAEAGQYQVCNVTLDENNYSREPSVAWNWAYQWRANDTNSQEWRTPAISWSITDAKVFVGLDYPTLELTLNNTAYNFTCNTSSDSQADDLMNVSLWTNITGNWTPYANLTFSEDSQDTEVSWNFTVNLTDVANGTYLWDCEAYLWEYMEGNSTTDSAWSPANWTFNLGSVDAIVETVEGFIEFTKDKYEVYPIAAILVMMVIAASSRKWEKNQTIQKSM